jgi:hypothetical protein
VITGAGAVKAGGGSVDSFAEQRPPTVWLWEGVVLMVRRRVLLAL